MGQVRVLLVEDDPADARLLREGLAEHGAGRHHLEHVTTLAEAEQRLADRPAPDVVLLDLGLPDSRGLETLDRLLALTRVPVVVLTGTNDDELAGTAVERGAQDYLVKGAVTGDTIGRAIRHAIERHRLGAALGERAKEMEGLAAINRILLEDAEPDETFQQVAAHLAGAMQWPDVCHAEVDVDGVVGAAGPAMDAGAPTLVADIEVGGDVRGRVRVGYAAPETGFLLPEEQRLVDAIGGAITGWLRRRDALQRLVRDEERLRVLVSHLPGMIWTTDVHLRATSYAGAALADVGITGNDLVGVPIAEVLGAGSSEETLGFFQRALQGETVLFERPWRARWWRNHLAPKRDERGRVAGTVCLTMDVTTEHDQRVELDATRERLEGLFTNASDAMILADDDGAYVDANPAACELTGYGRDELLTLHAWDLAADEAGTDAATALRMWRQFVADGEMQGQFPLRRRDGRVVVTDFRAVADIVPGVHLSSMRDITDRARAEAALASSEQLFRTMAESAQDAIYRLRLEPQLAFEYMNPAVEAISGFPVAAFRDNPFLYLERAHPEDAPALDPSRLPPGTTTTVQLRFQHADGHWIWLEDNRSLIVDGGRAVGVQGVVRDVTRQERTRQAMEIALAAQRRAAERLRAADELKNTFLTAVSHELRTPLTSVLGYAETLSSRGEQLTPQQVHELHDRLVANAVRLDQLLGDLLDVGRLSRGAVHLDRVGTDLTELARVTAAGVDFGERRLVIIPGPARAEVDPRMVERMLHNLLANAARHTPEDATIWVTCRSGPTDATIEVADDGPGIALADRERVFEPFWQGPASRTAPSPGTGIGLALVRQFAVLHGGRVAVGSRPGGGALFRVVLPLAPDGQVDVPLAPTA